MSDFRVHTMKRYRLRRMKDDKYTLQCPIDVGCLDPEAEVPLRQRGGTRDNQVFYARVQDLEPDDSRDRRHNMDAQAKLKRTYSQGLQDGTLVWLESVHISAAGEQTVTVVSLADFSRAEVDVADVLCRPDRVSRDNGNVVVTLVGPTYADGKNRRGNELIRQNVIEQQLDGPGIQVSALKKSDLDDKYTHAKKDRCIDLLNMREAALRDATTQQRPQTSWLATVTNLYPGEGARGYEGNNPFGSYWCVRPNKRSRPARPAPFSSPSPSPGPKARRPVPRLRLANKSVRTRCPSPLYSSALAAAAPMRTGEYLAGALTPASSCPSPPDSHLLFAAYPLSGEGFWFGLDDPLPAGFQAVGNLRAGPWGDLPAGFWGDKRMDEERCPKCGSLLKPDGSCEAEWCKS